MPRSVLAQRCLDLVVRGDVESGFAALNRARGVSGVRGEGVETHESFRGAQGQHANMCVGEGERERESVCVCERERERVCVCKKKKDAQNK